MNVSVRKLPDDFDRFQATFLLKLLGFNFLLAERDNNFTIGQRNWYLRSIEPREHRESSRKYGPPFYSIISTTHTTHVHCSLLPVPCSLLHEKEFGRT